MNPTIYQKIKNEISFEKKTIPTLTHIIIDFLIMATLSWTFTHSPSWYLYPPAAVLIAILMFRNFSLMHEAVHGVALSSKFLNDWIGLHAGVISFLPFENWKKIHLEHHKWAGNIDKDPSMSLVKIFPRWPSWLRAILNLMWRLWIPSLAFLQYSVFWAHSLKFAHRDIKNYKLIFSLIAPLAFWGCILSVSSGTFILASLIPGILLYLVAVEVVNFPHHLELPQLEGDQKLPLVRQHEIARTCLYPKWFAKNVVLNFNYHIEHHMYPNAPWYYLEKIHQLTSPELGSAYNTDPNFAWILKHRPQNLEMVLAGTSRGEISSHQEAA